MCTVSMIADHYRQKYEPLFPPQSFQQRVFDPPVTRAEFDALKKDVEEMKALLLRAKKYDEDNGEPDCEMEDKVALLRRVAEAVGVDLSAVFGAAP